MAISKTGKAAADEPRYSDPTDELIVAYVNSGEAQEYGPTLKDMGGLGLASSGIGAEIGTGFKRPVKGGLIGAGLGAGLIGVAKLMDLKRKRDAKKSLDSGNNRQLLEEKLKELGTQHVNINNNNALHGYLSKKLNR